MVSWEKPEEKSSKRGPHLACKNGARAQVGVLIAEPGYDQL